MRSRRMGVVLRCAQSRYSLDGSLQADDGVEAAAPDALAGKSGEEGLHRVQP